MMLKYHSNTAELYWNYTDPKIVDKNRRGYLTFEQEQSLLKKIPGPELGCLYMLRLGLRLIVLLLILDFFLGSRIGSVWSDFIMWGGIPVVLGMSLYFAQKGRRAHQEVRQARIAGGHGHISELRGGLKAYVGDIKLRTVEDELRLPPGKYYFNYFPKSRYLLSAEPVEEIPVFEPLEKGPTAELFDAEKYILEHL